MRVARELRVSLVVIEMMGYGVYTSSVESEGEGEPIDRKKAERSKE